VDKALERTKALKRLDLKIELLDANADNPNRMSDAEFNLLCDNVEATGITDPLLVRAMPGGRFRVVGGHHRLEVAKLFGFEDVPCTVIEDPDFDDDAERFQLVRMNMIRGKMDPGKFLKLYEGLSKKYEKEIMAEAFGFAEQAQFDKLVDQMGKNLPPEIQQQFKQAAKEVKTIDGLSKLLNGMFSKYGDTLEYGYMVLDYGGKDSIWLRMSNDTRKATLALGTKCMSSNRTMDDLLGGIVQMMAEGKLDKQLAQLIAETPPVKGGPTYEQGAELL
jgi:hypothetical protein